MTPPRAWHDRLFSVAHPIRTIVVFWALSMAALYVLQLAGLPFGFHIWPLNEDRNWITFMLDSPGKGVAQALWKIDGRNPLSPWWWVSVEFIVKKWPWGLNLVSVLMNLPVAITLFVFLDRLGRGQTKFFALVVALVASIWMITDNFSHISWNFYGAASFTLLTLYFYCGFIDSKRTNGRLCMLALLCYFIAFSTYTLQAGGIIGVGFLSLFRSEGNWRAQFKDTFFDCSIFLALFYCFNLIWMTTAPFDPNAFFIFNRAHFFIHFLTSFWRFIVPSAIIWHMEVVRNAWGTTSSVLIWLGAFAVMVALLRHLARPYPKEIIARLPIGWVLAALLALMVPTWIVETFTLWGPGLRSPMMQPVFQPMLYGTMIFAAARYMPSVQWRYHTVILGTAALTAWLVLFNLAYNNRLVLTTYHQMALARDLKKIVGTHDEVPRNFLIKLTNPNVMYASEEIPIPNYGRTVLGKNQFIRVMLPPKPKDTACSFYVEMNETNVFHSAGELDKSTAPYSRVKIVFFDGEKASFPQTVTRADIDGLCVKWNRKSPITQAVDESR